MTGAPELADLGARLADLADSGGPWDDPLPEIYRRAANPSAPADQAPAAGATGPDPSVTDSPVVPSSPVQSSPARSPHTFSHTFSAAGRSSAMTRRSRGWLRATDPVKVGAAASVVALVAGVGWLIHAANPAASEKSASRGQAQPASAAALTSAAGAASQGIPADGRSAAASEFSCAWPDPTSAVTLRAPARVRTGAAVSVDVRLSGPAVGITSPLIVAMSRGRVVGRLVPTVVPPGSAPRSSPPQALSADLTGTLRPSTCTQAVAASRSGARTSSSGTVLPAGRYRLIAVVAANRALLVSAAVTVTVTR